MKEYGPKGGGTRLSVSLGSATELFLLIKYINNSLNTSTITEGLFTCSIEEYSLFTSNLKDCRCPLPMYVARHCIST